MKMASMPKALDISSATVRIAPNLLKTPAIQSDSTVSRSAVDREELKTYKTSYFSRWLSILI